MGTGTRELELLEGTTQDTTHLHVSSESADCDGRYSREWISEESLAEFIEREAHTYWEDQRVDIEVTYFLTSEGNWGAEFGYQTEEGFLSYDANECDDEYCDTSAKLFRDHSAERMGY